MIKKVNEPISSSMTGPLIKPTVYSSHDKWGNPTGYTVVRIAEATMTGTYHTSDLAWALPSSATYPEFTIGSTTYQVTGTGARILYITPSFGFNTAVEILTTIISGSDAIVDTLGSVSMQNTVGLRASGTGGTIDYFPNNTNNLHVWHGVTNTIRLYAPRGSAQPANIFPPWEASDGSIMDPTDSSFDTKTDVITFDLLFP